MAWKTEILEHIRRNNRIIDICDEKEERACANGRKDKADFFRRKRGKLKMWIWGAIDTLAAIGYEIKYKDDGSIKSIDGDFAQEYRVRYRRFDADNVSYCDNYVLCEDGDKVQEVIDRAKTVSSEYKLIGVDGRIVSPNGDGESWHKIFDF